MYWATTAIREDGSVEKHLLSGNDLATRYNTPWILDAGVEAHAGTAVWAFRLGYATRVASYDRMALHAQEDLTLGALPPTDGTLRRVRGGNVPVLNGGIGAQFRLSDGADLLAGACTDQNYMDPSAIDEATDISGSFSYWDLYHLSCGVDLHTMRVKLTAGLVYSFGSDTGKPLDLEAVGDFISTNGDVPFKTNFNRLGLTFGFSYFVLGNTTPAQPPSP